MKWRGMCGGLVLLLGLAVPVSADPITGVLLIGGGVTYDTVDTTGGAIIDFAPLGGGTGNVVQVDDATGYFATELGLTFGGTLNILDLTNVAGEAGVPGPVFAPAGADLNIDGFLFNFNQAPNLTFELTKILLQPGTACTGAEVVGDSCVLGPFALLETADGLRINFDVQGWFRNNGDEGFFQGSFSTTFTGLTFQEAFTRLATGVDLRCGSNNLETNCSWDANFVNVAVPEPASLALLGIGLVGVGLRARRRRSAA